MEPGSSIKYAKAFNQKREVWLEGNSFFEVYKQEGSFFQVHINKAFIEVKGTCFQIQQTNAERNEITLFHGKIEFNVESTGEKIVMSPAQKVMYNPNNAQTQVENIMNINWKDGRYNFKDTPLPQLISIVNQIYQSNIILVGKFTEQSSFTGSIRYDESLNDVIEKLCFSLNLTYKNQKTIDQIISKEIEKAPIYDFISEDKVEHKVWLIDEDNVINDLVEQFKNVPSLYIADGHHRNASAVKVGLKRRGEGEYDKNAEFNYYLSVLFPADQLHIMDYNRLVKDLNGLTKEEFLDKIQENFTVTEVEGQYKPDAIHTFGMYLDKKWYKLQAKDSIIATDSVVCLDVSILQNSLLTPVLGIGDPRTDKRIDFVGGIRGLGELVKRVDSGEMTVAFAMYPTSMTQLMNIADDNKVMPPKSTWFEPKLRSGIFIHKLS